MTAEELIAELQKLPKHKRVVIGTLDTDCGEAKRVTDCGDYIEIESDVNIR